MIAAASSLHPGGLFGALLWLMLLWMLLAAFALPVVLGVLLWRRAGRLLGTNQLLPNPERESVAHSADCGDSL